MFYAFGRNRVFFVIAASIAFTYVVSMKKRMEIFLDPDMVALDMTGPLEVFNAATELLAHNNTYVRDGRIITLQGISAGIDMAFGW